LTDTTLSHYRQKRNLFLSVARLNLTVYRQNLSFRFEEFQMVNTFSFLISKYPAKRLAPPERRHTTQAQAAWLLAL
jgi:hypothetical protein